MSQLFLSVLNFNGHDERFIFSSLSVFDCCLQKQNLDRPFVFYKNKKVVWTVTSIVWLVVAAGIVFTCVEPILSHDYMTAFWTAFGPIFFGVVGWILYKRSEAKLD